MCETSFIQKVNMKAHIMIHMGEKPYPCTQCEKTYRQAGKLKAHTLRHTGDKPFLLVPSVANASTKKVT